MLRPPKEKFCTSPHKAVFAKIVNDPAFEEATLAALLQMETEMPQDCSPNQSATAHDQMVGARKYLETLCSIHLPQEKPKKDIHPQLDEYSGI